MSEIDASGALRKLAALRAGLPSALESFVDGKVHNMQDTAVALVPRRSGNLAEQLAREDAIEKQTEKGKTTWRFGFLSQEAKDRAWYWRFIEFGTRGYSKGERRRAGVDRKGRLRQQKVKRDIPARPAQPFLRPAFILFRQAIRRAGLKAVIPQALEQGAETGNANVGAVRSAIRRAQG